MKYSIKLLAVGYCMFVMAGCGKTSTVKNEVTLDELNRAVVVMSMSPAGAPRNVADLTNFPGFKGRPFCAPPPGKKFAINPTTHQLVVTDQ